MVMVVMMAKAINKKWILFVLFISIIISMRIPMNTHNSSLDFPIPFDEPQDDYLPSLYLEDTSVSEIGLEYDFYRQSCPQAESIVRSYMARIFSDQNDVSAGLLRLFFHDCFIEGCDASVLLDDSNGNQNHAIERQVIPNRSLRGFDKIDMIKEELEKACPGIVSCSDTLALATRDGIVLAGGPFYPVFTGRRDSLQSFFREAAAQIPKPSDNISQILDSFSLRGFDERDTVSLLGAHNIGKIGCQFIQDRIHNFSGTGLPDPSLASDFRNEVINTCETNKNSSTDGPLFPMRSRRTDAFSQGLSSSLSLGVGLDSHYFQGLLKGRGLLFSDQQLMADDRTASLVRAYASDDGSTFRFDFSRAMVKMSHLGVLTDSKGEVRTFCSLPVHNS